MNFNYNSVFVLILTYINFIVTSSSTLNSSLLHISKKNLKNFSKKISFNFCWFYNYFKNIILLYNIIIIKYYYIYKRRNKKTSKKIFYLKKILFFMKIKILIILQQMIERKIIIILILL